MSIVSSETIADDACLDLKELKTIHAALDGALSVRAIELLWVEFCNDQAANCLFADDPAIERFKIWVKTGNPDDAWS